ncbi:MAG TPA: hypothetical protein VHN37_07350 [Actinomycetota bacterium]|nr:hypothetical protein [Actinomycetota bacterium]
MDETATLSGLFDERRAGGPNSDIQWATAGRFVGIALMMHPPRKGRDVSLLAASLRACPGEACRGPGVEAWNVLYHASEGGEVLLEPGVYRLYLFTDGSRATARVRLHGLDGTTEVRPREGSGIDLKEPEARFESPNLAWYGSDYRLSTWGTHLTMFMGRTMSAGVASGQCRYEQSPDLPPEVAFAPTCSHLPRPAGADGREFYLDGPSTRGDFLFGTASLIVGESRGARPWGFWYQATAPVEEVSSIGLFLSYN